MVGTKLGMAARARRPTGVILGFGSPYRVASSTELASRSGHQFSRRPGDSPRARLPLFFRALLLVAVEFAKRDLFRNVLNDLVLDPLPKHGRLPRFAQMQPKIL